MLRASVLWIAIAAVLIASRANAEDPAPEWLRLEADNVTVLTDAPRKEATAFLLPYLGFRHAFATLFQPAGTQPAPVTILLFASQEGLLRCTAIEPGAPSNVLALTTEVDGDIILGLAVDGGRSDALKTVYEFDTMCSLRRCGYFLPRWIEQGAGEVLATFRLAKSGSTVGEKNPTMEPILSSRQWLPWDIISRIERGSAEYYNPEIFRFLAGQSWGLMQLVLFSDPTKARDRFFALTTQIKTSRQADQAVAAVLQLDPTKIDAEVRRVVRRTTPLQLPFDQAAARSRICVTPAPSAEVAVRTAALMEGHVSKRELVAAELQKAQTAAPHSPLVLEALARQEMHQSNPGPAVEYYRAAIEAGSKNPKALLASARSRLNDAKGAGGEQFGEGGEPAKVALGEIRRALSLNPGDGDALQLLGRALFVSPGTTEADLTSLPSGVASSETAFWVHYYRGLILLHVGPYPSAVAELQGILQDSAVPPKLREAALNDFANYNGRRIKARVEGLVRSGDCSGARELIDRELNPQLWTPITQAIDALYAWVLVSSKLQAMDRFAREGKKVALRAAQIDFVKKHPDEPAAQKIRAELDAIEPDTDKVAPATPP